MIRGEVWLCTLDPTVGREIRKTRPCVIVSPDEMNRRLSTVTAVPLTSGSRKTVFRITVRFQDRDSLILADQMRTLDKARLVKRLGRLDDGALSDALAVLREMFAA